MCPGYRADSLRQALGRIHRDGAKSKSIQYIVFAAGTVEEKVKRRVDAKLHRLDLLNDGDLDVNNSEEPDKLPDTMSEKEDTILDTITEPITEPITERNRRFKPSASNGKYVEECPHYRPDKFKETPFTKEFHLPEEQEEFRNACDGSTWKAIIWDFDQWLRTQIKHGDREDLQEVRDRLNEFEEGNGVKLYD